VRKLKHLTQVFQQFWLRHILVDVLARRKFAPYSGTVISSSQESFLQDLERLQLIFFVQHYQWPQLVLSEEANFFFASDPDQSRNNFVREIPNPN